LGLCAWYKQSSFDLLSKIQPSNFKFDSASLFVHQHPLPLMNTVTAISTEDLLQAPELWGLLRGGTFNALRRQSLAMVWH
jgi:hypothetical protein